MIGVACAVPLQELVAFELAEVVAQLIQAISFLGEAEGGEDGLVNLLGGPAADVAAAVQEHFQQADDPVLVDFDAGITHRSDGDRQRDSLQQRKIDVDVEPLGLKTGEAVRDELELFRTASRWSSPFFRPKSLRFWSRVRCAGRGRTFRTV